MTIALTKKGMQKLQNEYDALIADRKPAVLELKKARDMGDLSENGYYKAARWKLSSIDGRIRRLKRTLVSAIIIHPKKSDTVLLGNTVMLETSKQTMLFQVVGSLEANPTEKKISNVSPLGTLLLGKKVGETIVLQKNTYLIKQIS